MSDSASSRRGPAPVSVLFSPEMVPIIDIFRALGDFEVHYDVSALDGLEAQLARLMSRESAKGVVSDALLLAFGLRRERRDPVEYGTLKSRRGTIDEYRLMAIIGATFWHDFVLASDAAASLGIAHPQAPISLAFDIARRLESAGLKMEAPDPRLLGLPLPEGRRDVVLERTAGSLRIRSDG
jgi:hypothetical protein